MRNVILRICPSWRVCLPACQERSRAIAVISQRAMYTARGREGGTVCKPDETPMAAQVKFGLTVIGYARAARCLATSAPFARQSK